MYLGSIGGCSRYLGLIGNSIKELWKPGLWFNVILGILLMESNEIVMSFIKVLI